MRPDLVSITGPALPTFPAHRHRTIATFGLFGRLVLPLCARCHHHCIRGAQRGLHWLAGPPQGSKMKQASIGRFFTKPNGPKASNKTPRGAQTDEGNRETLETVISLEKKRVREVTLRSKKTTCPTLVISFHTGVQLSERMPVY